MGGNHQGRRDQVERVAKPRRAAGFADQIMFKIKGLDRIRFDSERWRGRPATAAQKAGAVRRAGFVKRAKPC
jgi:hypothetical protein